MSTNSLAGWYWSDGTVWNYVKWLEGQPDDSKGNESCLHMSYDDPEHYNWNDYDCEEEIPFVCKSGKNTKLKQSDEKRH